MPPIQRGRIPGAVGRSAGRPGPGFVHGLRSNGPAGRIGGGRALFAQAGQLTPDDTASDATMAPVRTLPAEPPPALFDTVRLGVCELPLFARGGPQPEDVIQGRLNNCPVGATLMALAHTTPAIIPGMVTSLEDSASESEEEGESAAAAIRLYRVSLPMHAPVEITNRLYFTGESLTATNISYTRSSNNTAWMSFIEKAYAATLRRGYVTLSRVGAGGPGIPDTRDVFTAIAGSCETGVFGGDGNQFYSSSGELTPLRSGQLRTMFRQARHRATIAATRSDTRGPVEASHSYTVLGFAGGQVHLRNPRGGPRAVVSLTEEQFQQYFFAIIQAAGR